MPQEFRTPAHYWPFYSLLDPAQDLVVTVWISSRTGVRGAAHHRNEIGAAFNSEKELRTQATVKTPNGFWLSVTPIKGTAYQVVT